MKYNTKTEFFPSSIIGGRRGRVDLVIPEPAHGHTLLDIVIADPTRVDLVAQETIVPQHNTAEKAVLQWATTRGHLHRHRDVRCVVVSNG